MYKSLNKKSKTFLSQILLKKKNQDVFGKENVKEYLNKQYYFKKLYRIYIPPLVHSYPNGDTFEKI